MLHAVALELPHPKTGDRLRIVSAEPEDFRQVQQALRSAGGAPR
jgi:hypothetical protein